MENEELIRQRMEKTRESLTDKLEILENRLIGSVHEATSAVKETVENVKESMHEGVESVKDAVDVQAHVARRPWLMFGGAVLGGYVLGSLLSRDEPAPVQIREAPAAPPKKHTTGNGHHKPSPKRETVVEKTSSFLQAIEPEIRHLKGMALGITCGLVREMLTREAPPQLAQQLRTIVDGITQKIGGEPVPPSDLPFTETATHQTAGNAPANFETPRW